MLRIQKLTCPDILTSIEMQAAPDEFLGMAGPNGSGKTTLLKCISGIIRSFSGTIHIDGQDTRRMSQRELAASVSYVPQIVETRIPYSVLDFMMMSRFPRFGLTRQTPPARPLEDILDELGVHHLKDRVTGSLSGGELQKVLIAAALAQDTAVVLLDEPASHLDPLKSAELLELLIRLKERRDRLYLMVSHQAEHLARIGDRVVAMKDGEILDSYSPESVRDPDWQQQVYGPAVTA